MNHSWHGMVLALALALALASASCGFVLDVDSLGEGCTESGGSDFETCTPRQADPIVDPPGCEGAACPAQTTCIPGEYERRPSDEDVADEDVARTCAKCPSGTFSTTENAAQCEKWSPCAPGFVELTAPTDTRDRVCSLCGDGRFELDHRCAPLSICAPGTYVAAAATPTDDRVCKECPPGAFSTERNAPGCRDWQRCPPDEVESEAPSSTRDRVCASCGAEEFAQAGHCFPTTACREHEYETVAPSTVQDRECRPCVPDEVIAGERICSPVGHIQSHRFRERFVNIEGGVLGVTEVDPSRDSTQWSLEPIDGYYRIRHRYQRDQYLHMENGELEVGPVDKTWWSARWRFIDVSPQFSEESGRPLYQIQNMYLSTAHLHVENDVLEAGTFQDGQSAAWLLPPL